VGCSGSFANYCEAINGLRLQLARQYLRLHSTTLAHCYDRCPWTASFPCAAGAAEHYPEVPVRIRVLEDVAYMHEMLRLVDTLSLGPGIAIAPKV
jgi:hypothetical protein